MLGQLIEQTDQLTIVDMEASVEHMSRGTIRHTDVLLVVAEPYYRSLETAGKAATLGRELGIRQVYVVANKVRTPRDEEAIRHFFAERDFQVIAALPFDDAVLDADQQGTPILDYRPDSAYVSVVQTVKARLADFRF